MNHKFFPLGKNKAAAWNYPNKKKDAG